MPGSDGSSKKAHTSFRARLSAAVGKLRHHKGASVTSSTTNASFNSEASAHGLAGGVRKTPRSNGSESDTLWSPGSSPKSEGPLLDLNSSFALSDQALSSPSSLPQSPKDRLGRNQGRLQVCWSYAIGNAIAMGAQAKYGVLLNPETIAHNLMGEFGRFDTHSVRRVMHCLQDKWADSEHPFIMTTFKEKGDDVDLDRPVCVHISDVTCFGPEQPEPFPERPGWYQSDARDFDAFHKLCVSGDMSAVVSIWTKLEGSARAEGHAVAFENTSGRAIMCKNSHPNQPVLYAGFSNFKGAVAFRVHLSDVDDTDLVTPRYGCHHVMRRGISLPVVNEPSNAPAPNQAK